ncbi:MAG: transcriptional regulator FtsR [Candidatus Geothermincolia bacterium]
MASEEKKYGIGEVQELLKKEFPDITISKIRFLEKEGLINPERTPSGYRKYSKANIKQLSYILRLQREEYLPLSVIKRKIQDLKSGKVVAGDLTVMSGQGAEPALTGAVPVSLDLAPAKLGLSAETIRELVEYGIVSVHDGPEGKYFPASEIKILNLTKEFFRYGVEPRHLRMYTQFVGREASFIEQIIRPQLQHKDPNTKRSAIKDLENLMALSQMFIQALLRESLSRYLPRPASFDMLDEEQGEEEIEHEEVLEVVEAEAPEDAARYAVAEPVPAGEESTPAEPSPQMFPE